MKCVPDQEIKMKKNFFSDGEHWRGNVHRVTRLDKEKRQSHLGHFFFSNSDLFYLPSWPDYAWLTETKREDKKKTQMPNDFRWPCARLNAMFDSTLSSLDVIMSGLFENALLLASPLPYVKTNELQRGLWAQHSANH